MKATGIVRRIDDLGRVVIPKEIRRTLKIRESEPLEIFTDRNGEIILKKYSPIGEFSSGAQQLADAAAKTCGKLFCICDQEQVVAAARRIRSIRENLSVKRWSSDSLTGILSRKITLIIR